jgi:hypothetical protein
VAVAKLGESEQGLPARAQAPPPGAELVTVAAELGGQEAQGKAGHYRVPVHVVMVNEREEKRHCGLCKVALRSPKPDASVKRMP